MSKRFVFAFRVVPPEHTVLVRSGGSYFDAWYSKWSRQWFGVYPGGTLEKIAAPEMLFVSEKYARENPAELTHKRLKRENVLRPKKISQMMLFS